MYTIGIDVGGTKIAYGLFIVTGSCCDFLRS
jgi:predicted NBD/HSP70 family sugar kinase